MSTHFMPQGSAVCPLDIEFTEAINDSPRFRRQLQVHQQYFQRLESRLNEILKYVTAMVEFGKSYTSTFYKLSVSVNQLCEESFSGNVLAQSTFHSISEAYARTVDLTKQYHEESNSVVYGKLQAFIKTELAKVSEARALFENISCSADEALARNAAGGRAKPGEAIEGRNNLMSVGACFAHTTLDYVESIHMAHVHKDHAILDALWSFVKESSAFFSKGHAFFDEWTAMDNGGVADMVKALEHKIGYTSRQMQDIHSLVPMEMYQHPAGISPDPDVVLEGYLFKRSSNAFKTWNRRWFQIKDNKLLYLHRFDEDHQPTVMEDNLMLCLVRPAPSNVDRIGCFELVTPTRSHLLQADSESLCNAWMRALQRTILHLHESDEPINRTTLSSTALSVSGSPSSSSGGAEEPKKEAQGCSIYEQIISVAGNNKCADCGQNDPKWASINLAVTLCIECCGIHRSLGVQVSKVRSLTMDSLDGAIGEVFTQLGNERVNSIYLAYLPKRDIVPSPANEQSTRAVREAWIKAKYVEKRFSYPAKERAHHRLQKKTSAGVVKSASSADMFEFEREALEKEFVEDETQSDVGDSGRDNPLYQRLNSELPSCSTTPTSEYLSAAKLGRLPILTTAISRGFDINQHIQGTTLLHTAVENGQTAAVEFLLLNGSKINILDDQMNSPLHLAAKDGHTLQVCQLLKRGADKSLVNCDGVTPLDIAVEGKHADIVTLFRVHTMRDEFNEEFNNPMDDTVESVITDITRRANIAKSSTMHR